MSRTFSIECERDWSIPDPSASATESQATAAWSFPGDFEALTGQQAEPDAQFFVESWTLGVEAALCNFEQRRRTGTVPHAASYARSHSVDFLREHAFFTELSSEARAALADEDSEQHCQTGAHPYEYAEPPCDPMNLARARSLLGVTLASTHAEIKAAYRRLAASWHPDHRGWATPEARRQANEKMIMLNEAYRMLR